MSTGTNPSSRVITILQTAMRLLGVSNREAERKLGLSPSYLSRLFSGSIELRVQHIFDIGEALGLRPDEIARIAFPEPPSPPTEAFTKLREILAPFQRVDDRPSKDKEEAIELLVTRSLRRLLASAPSDSSEGELPT